MATEHALSDTLREASTELTGGPDDFISVLERAHRKPFVLIGEASHGTHEFYRIRAELTKELIREHGCTAVAVEADWPDAYEINRYVRGLGSARDAGEALAGFRRFPQWMWRNADVLDFVGWLRAHNEALPAAERVGFYGLDLYSLHASMEAVLAYLDKVDPEAAGRARSRYGCFEQFGDDPQAYGYAARFGMSESCERAVLDQLQEMQRNAAELASRDGRQEPDELFFAEQNARLVLNAERYYRAMFGGRASSWNLRDRHMAETLEALASLLASRGRRGTIAVWAHNSHLGDARATEMAHRGELNVGQLVRQQHGDEALLIGFTTYDGTVTAATDWGGAAERKRVRPGREDSYEGLLHALGGGSNLALDLSEPAVAAALARPRLERAIGVIYRPETERESHYFRASLPKQFDVVLHYDHTRAVEPLERTAEWEAGELPETYPTGF
ncbi:MAG TPA: erythromycin esterase family protein [Gemmatimonadales bacterium]|nr:erythromycin esterase family protein [Gemmatimonadales bacterium]